MHFDLEKFQQTKTYDLLMGLPLIVWFGYVEGVKLRPNLSYFAREVLQHPDSLYANMRFFGLFATIAFNFLTVYLIVMRSSPVRRSDGWLPKICGFVGTFLAVTISLLPVVTLSLFWQTVSSVLQFVGGVGSLIVLSRLGRSFSIMPEARRLVTSGPYAYARHPLYAVEIITVTGMVMLFRQPWAGLLGVGVVTMLVVRSRYEEQVLTAAYPEYVAYKARVKRFGFI